MVSTRSKAGASTGDKRAADAPDAKADTKKPKVEKDGKLEVGDEGEIGLKKDGSKAERQTKETGADGKREDVKEEGTENADKNGAGKNQQDERTAKGSGQDDVKTRSGPGESKQDVGLFWRFSAAPRVRTRR